jgi:23S rRNA pseudouridine1911/1915/1917 synthase
MKQTGTTPDIDILYEDNHLLAVNKPAGILSQEDHTGNTDLLNLCKEYIKKEYNKPGKVFLGLLHRLDRPVSGVMLFAKTSKAASRISEQIRKRKVKKKYLAVVEGTPPPNGFLSHHLKKDTTQNRVMAVPAGKPGAKEAQLIFQKLDQRQNLALLEIDLITGRPHQIRVQLSEEGFPIWGDQKYGKPGKPSPALHAWKLTVTHPTLKNESVFTANPPKSEPWNKFNPELFR